jgi:hypothetical protein
VRKEYITESSKWNDLCDFVSNSFSCFYYHPLLFDIYIYIYVYIYTYTCNFYLTNVVVISINNWTLFTA